MHYVMIFQRLDVLGAHFFLNAYELNTSHGK